MTKFSYILRSYTSIKNKNDKKINEPNIEFVKKY